jgi:aspartyl-tRNA(Asn)/glutamyl-tRNA(Gln) amidotransferase subunit C
VKLQPADVEHVAHLARLALTADEMDRYGEQLSSILEYAARLRELDTDAIPATATILSLANVMRQDHSEPSLPQADVLANAPAVDSGCFRVPLVLEGEG